MSFQPKFLASAIGSMPFDNADYAVEVSLKNLPQAPIWPQLPKFGMNEQMEIQYSEGMPCAVIDRDKQRLYFNTSGDYSESFAAFYETYMAATEGGDLSALAISPAFSRGIYALEKRLQAGGKKLPYVKVQTTGPCSFALTIVDENKRAIYYNEEFLDMIVKTLALKCRWQIRKFKPFAERIICFVDEPILSAFGSSTYVSVKREDVVARIGEVVEAIHAEGGLAGIHCCGNTEWSILIDAGVDIVNFDAFGFGETIAMYADAVKSHLARGGVLAWGIVPTSTAIREQTADTLAAKLEQTMQHLAGKGIDPALIAQQAMLTPSCGTGSLEPADALKVFETLAALSVKMRAQYRF
ncbi:MAG: hypothetical protein WC381_02730 [Kiritimatiellia bacterium]|jgi:hypothetical protein